MTPRAEPPAAIRGLIARRDLPGVALVAVAAAAGLLAAVSPPAALLLAVGAVAALVLVADLTLALCALTLASFLAILPTVAGGAVGASKLVGALVVASWIGALWRREPGQARFTDAHPALAWLLVAFVTWVLASVAWAQDPGAAAISVLRYAPNALLVPIIFTALRERRAALAVVATFVGGATFAALYGIANPGSSGFSDQAVRVAGTVGDANELAAVLVAAVPLSVALAVYARGRPALRTLALAAGACCLAGTLLTLSRGGLIALGATAVAATLLAGRRRPAASLIAVTVAAAAVAYFAAIASPVARDRVLEAGGGTGRSDLWTIALRMADDRPLLGVGAGNFPITSVHYLLRPGAIRRDDFIVDTPKVAHNLYLGVLAELGAVGLLLLAGVVAAGMASALRAARRFGRDHDEPMEVLARAVVVALVGALVASLFISDPYGRELWLLVGLGPALLRLARPETG